MMKIGSVGVAVGDRGVCMPVLVPGVGKTGVVMLMVAIIVTMPMSMLLCIMVMFVTV